MAGPPNAVIPILKKEPKGWLSDGHDGRDELELDLRKGTPYSLLDLYWLALFEGPRPWRACLNTGFNARFDELEKSGPLL